MPHLSELQKKYASKDLEVIGHGKKIAAKANGLGNEIWDKISERKELHKGFELSRNASMEFQIKANMLTSSDLVGGGVNSYNDRQGIVPAQQLNMRDLIRTTPSPTGNFISYRETNTVQTPGIQTEGNTKTQVEYQFTAQTSTSKYIAAFLRISRQMLFSAPFIQSTLPMLLQRDYLKKENDYLFTSIASNSTGTSVPAGTLAKADAEELMQVIASQRSRNFNADFAVVDWTTMKGFLTTKPNDYSVPGGWAIDQNGNIRVMGCLIVPASWAQSDHALVLDSRYYERLETDSLNVQFSYEDNDNFERNLVTVRIECFTELNRLRDDSSVYYDFGNS